LKTVFYFLKLHTNLFKEVQWSS